MLCHLSAFLIKITTELILIDLLSPDKRLLETYISQTIKTDDSPNYLDFIVASVPRTTSKG